MDKPADSNLNTGNTTPPTDPANAGMPTLAEAPFIKENDAQEAQAPRPKYETVAAETGLPPATPEPVADTQSILDPLPPAQDTGNGETDHSPFGVVTEEAPPNPPLPPIKSEAPGAQDEGPKGKKTILAGVAGLVLLLFGVGAALLLVQEPQDIRKQASEVEVATNPVTASCSEVKVYDESWVLLTTADLATLGVGDIVRFAVSGTTSEGTFDRARFTINGVNRPEVSARKPGSDEFYEEYTIPAGQTTFTVTGQVHHETLGMWF